MMDLELKMTMYVYGLEQAKEIKYTVDDCNSNLVYVFDNYEEYKNYFITNGLTRLNKGLLDMCIYKKTSKGKIITRKIICDSIITRLKKPRIYTCKEIREIHAKGNITPWEKVVEWEQHEICAPASYDRCARFNNCHECLVNYASENYDYQKGNYSGIKRQLRKKNK